MPSVRPTPSTQQSTCLVCGAFAAYATPAGRWCRGHRPFRLLEQDRYDALDAYFALLNANATCRAELRDLAELWKPTPGGYGPTPDAVKPNLDAFARRWYLPPEDGPGDIWWSLQRTSRLPGGPVLLRRPRGANPPDFSPEQDGRGVELHARTLPPIRYDPFQTPPAAIDAAIEEYVVRVRDGLKRQATAVQQLASDAGLRDPRKRRLDVQRLAHRAYAYYVERRGYAAIDSADLDNPGGPAHESIRQWRKLFPTLPRRRRGKG